MKAYRVDLQPWTARKYLLEKTSALSGHAFIYEGPWGYPQLLLNLGDV